MSDIPMPGRCGAKRKGSSPPHYCEAYPVRGSGVTTGRPRCKVHGGLTPSGSASPHFVHGKYSRDAVNAGPRFKKLLDEHSADQGFASLRDEAALLRTFISERLSSGGELTDKDRRFITNMVEVLSRALRTEMKKIELERDYLSAKQASTLFGAMQMAVLDEVPDQETRTKIAMRMRALLAQSGEVGTTVAANAIDAPVVDGPVAIIGPT